MSQTDLGMSKDKYAPPSQGDWFRPHMSVAPSGEVRAAGNEAAESTLPVNLARCVCLELRHWLARRSPDLTIVSLLTERQLPALSGGPTGGVFWCDEDPASALQWSCSLLGRNQHVAVLLSARQLRQHLDLICNGLGRGLLLVVVQLPEDDVVDGTGSSANQSSLSVLGLMPWDSVMVPADPFDCQQMVAMALARDGVQAMLVSDRTQAPVPLPSSRKEVRHGRSESFFRGGEIVLAAMGEVVAPVMAAARRLRADGLEVTVINFRFATPFDHRTLARETRDASQLFVVDTANRSSTLLTPLQGETLRTLRRIGWPVAPRQVILCGATSAATFDEQVRQIVDAVCGGGAAKTETLRPSCSPAGREPLDLFGFTEESLLREHQAVERTVLLPGIEEWFQIYSTVGHRGRYLWQWCQHGAFLTSLPFVRPDLLHHVVETKVLSMILCVLLDDAADERGREALLEKLVEIVEPRPDVDLSGLSEAERQWAEVTRQLTEIYYARMREYPLYHEYVDQLNFDQHQYFNTMRYSSLLNRHLNLLNPTEHSLYLPHAMNMMCFATLDLMCSPDFPPEELGRLREALWQLAYMGRIGNLLATWRREIPQSDFTSGVFARAVVSGDLTVDDLEHAPASRVEGAVLAGRHERHFARKWRACRHRYIRKAREIRSLDWKKLLDGNERFFRMHLGSRGLI